MGSFQFLCMHIFTAVQIFEAFEVYLFIQGIKTELRRIPVPSHRYAPLKDKWMSIYTPVVEQLHLQMRFELKSRNVEIKVIQNFTLFGSAKSW
jgi:isocitrate dehydrogenase kinase/phosphatase